MTTKVIITNPEAQAKPIRVRTVDVAGGPQDVFVEAGKSTEAWVHSTRLLEVAEVAVDTADPHPQSEEFLEQFFSYAHLPPHLQSVSRPFWELARIVLTLPRNPERTTALRKLLEAKDAAVRARVAKD